ENEEDAVVRTRHTSPDGHVISVFLPRRADEFCAKLFNARKGKSSASQYNFWTRCIMGSTLPQD
ncbi:MAG: hypothetical protein ABJH63_07635, partial [Rhizobiaceae bacterium]